MIVHYPEDAYIESEQYDKDLELIAKNLAVLEDIYIQSDEFEQTAETWAETNLFQCNGCGFWFDSESDLNDKFECLECEE